MSKYSLENRQDVIARCNAGEKVSKIVAETGIPRSTVYLWLKDEQERRAQNEHGHDAVTLKEYNQTKEHSRRLEGMLEILKTCGCAPHDPLQQRLEALERLYHENKYSVRMLCEALDVPRGTFYNHILRNKRDNSSFEKRREELRCRIRQIYDDSNQIFGAPKIAAVLQSQGLRVSKEMVRRLMREMGLESIRARAKKQYMDESRKPRNLVNRSFNADRPNQIWVSDVTYFRLNGMVYYICVVMDLFARKVIACRIGASNSTQLLKATFKAAYEQREVEAGLIFHSD